MLYLSNHQRCNHLDPVYLSMYFHIDKSFLNYWCVDSFRIKMRKISYRNFHEHISLKTILIHIASVIKFFFTTEYPHISTIRKFRIVQVNSSTKFSNNLFLLFSFFFQRFDAFQIVLFHTAKRFSFILFILGLSLFHRLQMTNRAISDEKIFACGS